MSYIHIPTHIQFILFFRIIYLFIFGCSRSSLLRGLFSSCGDQGFSLRWLLLLRGTRSRAHGLQYLRLMGSRARASSYGAGPQLLCSMWDLPGSGIEPVSPALAGRFIFTVLPGKSSSFIFNKDTKVIYPLSKK